MATKAKKSLILDALAEAIAAGKTLREAYTAAVLAGKAAKK